MQVPSTLPTAATSAQPDSASTVSVQQLQQHIARAFRDKPRVVELTLAAMLARGHVLLEDVPGVGKTTLALAIAKTLGLRFRRIQFTSDMLPADILGVSVLERETSEFSFRPGPIFAELVLADEINRTTPRTQSALLEAMSEGRVSVDNQTHALPNPFHVLATQNPLENFGTYPLPESQLDRFMIRIAIGYPSPEVERALLMERDSRQEPVDALGALASPDSWRALQARVAQVKLSDEIAGYIMALVEQTRSSPRVRVGVSTRGALAMSAMARALAMVRGRAFCIPDDVRDLAVPCFAHRLSIGAGTSREEAEGVMDELARAVPVPA